MTKSIAAGLLHRAFSVFLFNEEGKLLIQQRAACKITFPSMWANTCCSHPLSVAEELDETDAIGTRRAAIRKLEHELGITELSVDDLVFLTKIHYEAAQDADWAEHEIDWLFFAKKPVNLQINDNEIDAYRWVSPDDLRQMFADNAEGKLFLAPWFQLIAEKFLFNWWPRVDEILANKGLPTDLKEGLPAITRLGTPGNARTAASFL